jgi:hypothetical protein
VIHNPATAGTGTEPPPSRWADSPISDQQARLWVAKGHRCAGPVLALAGDAADRAEVVPARVESPADWLFGNFMVAWLDGDHAPRRIRHLPDATVFLRLLQLTYAPVLRTRPDLAPLLTDTSRLEMSLTNDVLQIQLAGPDEGYSMIRHHALMLFFAALWLEQPGRDQWLDLYDQLLTYIDARPGGRPSLQTLAQVESRAFADFTTLAPRTLTPASVQELFTSASELGNIADYQLYAGAAIGLLWRRYRSLPVTEHPAWQREQLSLYCTPDYLEQEWNDHP